MVRWGRPVSFRCKAIGYPIPTITWYSSNTSRVVRSDTVGSTWRESTLQIASFDGWQDGGEYRCRASNRAGLHETAIISLQCMLLNARAIFCPNFVFMLIFTTVFDRVVTSSQSQLVLYGSTFSLACSVVSYGPSNASILWFKNGRPLNVTPFIDATARGMMWKRTSRLVISAASLSIAGNYSCSDPRNHVATVNGNNCR